MHVNRQNSIDLDRIGKFEKGHVVVRNPLIASKTSPRVCGTKLAIIRAASLWSGSSYSYGGVHLGCRYTFNGTRSHKRGRSVYRNWEQVQAAD